MYLPIENWLCHELIRTANRQFRGLIRSVYVGRLIADIETGRNRRFLSWEETIVAGGGEPDEGFGSDDGVSDVWWFVADVPALAYKESPNQVFTTYLVQ